MAVFSVDGSKFVAVLLFKPPYSESDRSPSMKKQSTSLTNNYLDGVIVQQNMKKSIKKLKNSVYTVYVKLENKKIVEKLWKL